MKDVGSMTANGNKESPAKIASFETIAGLLLGSALACAIRGIAMRRKRNAFFIDKIIGMNGS